jgi:hypothetical protein
VGAILFYQPTVGRNPNNTTETSVYQTMVVVPGPQFQQWSQPQSSHHPRISLTVRVGIPATEPTKAILAVGPYGIPVNGRYLYQQGHHYIMARINEHGDQFWEVQSIASGIAMHAVGHLSQGEEYVLSSVFPPQEKLLLW